jgi:NADPH:quinone reductase-like Zn-dependent oxidoreductase
MSTAGISSSYVPPRDLIREKSPGTLTKTRAKTASGITTRAYRIHGFGTPDVLTLEKIPLPKLRAGEAIVRVEAASINPVDFKIREGLFPLVSENELPYALGRDLAGIVESVSCDGSGLVVGDRVYAMLGIDRGAYADRVIVKIGEAAVRPANLSAIEAAAIPLAALTAWQGLFDQGRLLPGQTVLIHAAAGGVGHFAVQFAKAHGARVIATASAENIELVRHLGADQVIDYKHQPFENITGKVDLVYDLVGGETQRRSWDVIREGGALISTLEEPSEDEAHHRKIRAAHYMTHPSVAQLNEIRDLVERGLVKVIVQQVFPFAAAADAHRLMKNGSVRGKLVLDLSR